MLTINKSLKILFILNSIFVFAGALFTPLYALYVQRIDNRIIAVSITWGVQIAASTFFAFFVGKYGDKIKEKEFILAAGYFLRFLAWTGLIFVNNLISLLLIQIVIGVGESMGGPAWNAIFAKHLDGHKEVKDYSDWAMLSNLIIALGTILGGVVVTFFGFNYIFAFMGLLAFVSFVGVVITPRRTL